MITVSNRRHRGKKPLPPEVAARTVYAGRPGPFGNPFIASKLLSHLSMHTRTRKDAITLFRTWFKGNTNAAITMRTAAAALPDDAILECWCVPMPCHAQVIADYENRRRGFIP